MQIQNPHLTQFLKETWDTAYRQGYIEFDYTGQDLAEGRIKKLRQDLYNYRRKIRTLKLNPNYVTEWRKINACKMINLSRTRLRVYLIPQVVKTPIINLTVPTSLTGLPNGRTST